MAERRRRHVLDGLSWGDGCRCCYDPAIDGGEYVALVEARQTRLLEDEQQQQQSITEDNNYPPTIIKEEYNNNNNAMIII